MGGVALRMGLTEHDDAIFTTQTVNNYAQLKGYGSLSYKKKTVSTRCQIISIKRRLSDRQ